MALVSGSGTALSFGMRSATSALNPFWPDLIAGVSVGPFLLALFFMLRTVFYYVHEEF